MKIYNFEGKASVRQDASEKIETSDERMSGGEEEYEVRTGGSHSSSHCCCKYDYVAVGTAKNSRRVTQQQELVRGLNNLQIIRGPVLVFNLATHIQFIVFNDSGPICSNLLLHRILTNNWQSASERTVRKNIEKKITIRACLFRRSKSCFWLLLLLTRLWK